MTEPITFTIPHRLTRLNEYIEIERGGKQKNGVYYSGKWKAAKIKKEQTALCGYYIPKIAIDYPIDITYIWTVKTQANDLGNVAFGQKFIEDAMQHKGFIKNDNLTVIKRVTHEYVKGNNEQVEVIVRRWEDGTN